MPDSPLRVVAHTSGEHSDYRLHEILVAGEGRDVNALEGDFNARFGLPAAEDMEMVRTAETGWEWEYRDPAAPGRLAAGLGAARDAGYGDGSDRARAFRDWLVAVHLFVPVAYHEVRGD